MGEVQAREPEIHVVREQYQRSFAAGQIVFEPGDPARALFVVQSGEIEILRPMGSGTRSVDCVRSGEFFGEMAVVLGGRHSVRAVAATEAKLLEIDRDTFRAMCLEKPEIALRVIERLTVRVLQLEERMGTLAVTELIRPVVAHLLEGAVPEDEQLRVATNLRAIADGSGLSMLDAHRAVQELLDTKLVRLENDQLWIGDRDALLRYPEDSGPAIDPLDS
jgi:CRP-like cAMP-binding protein